MLTILIPSYNHARYIGESIDSARRIDIPGRRIVIIDDASTDNSVATINEYLSREGSEGIEFIAKPVNRGVIDTVNVFLAMCRTEYVYFMASDDVALSPGLEALLAVLEANASLQFAIGGGSNVFPDGRNTPIYGSKHSAFFALPREQMRRELFLDCPSPILCQSSIFRLIAIQAVGGFDDSLIADDYALFTKLFLKYPRKDHDFKYLPDIPCVHYRHHSVNSHRDLPRQALSTKQVLDALTPVELHAQAVGYKLAYYTLVAIFRREPAAVRKILSMVPAGAVPWFGVGLVRHSLKKLISR